MISLSPILGVNSFTFTDDCGKYFVLSPTVIPEAGPFVGIIFPPMKLSFALISMVSCHPGVFPVLLFTVVFVHVTVVVPSSFSATVAPLPFKRSFSPVVSSNRLSITSVIVAVTEVGILSVILLKISYKLCTLSAVIYFESSDATSFMNLETFLMFALLPKEPVYFAASNIPRE